LAREFYEHEKTSNIWKQGDIDEEIKHFDEDFERKLTVEQKGDIETKLNTRYTFLNLFTSVNLAKSKVFPRK